MHYYIISIISSPLDPLTYQSLSAVDIGTKVSITLNNREKEGVVIATCEKPSFKTSEILEVYDEVFSAKQLELAKFISSYYICSLGEALGLMTPFETKFSKEFIGEAEASLPKEQKQDIGSETLVLQENEENFPKEQKQDIGSETLVSQEATCESKNTSSKIELSPKQTKALEFLKQHKTSLLFGDTGSGKTEIYMKYFEQMIAQDKRCIFLMPEISLTPQMSQRLQEHFGDSVVMWHSKLTKLQKQKALTKIYDGSAYIIAGPRSALFLPVKDLGLIVVDEEHDDSYKSSSKPRYNARDMAIYMGSLYNLHVVLGSATPSLNSFVKFPHIRLKGGYFNSNKEFIYERSVENLSPLVLSSLKRTLELKEQAIVFLPTRANFKYLVCQDCGHTYKCVFCSIGMSIHQNSRALKCHYCNYSQAIPQVCSECGSHALVSSRLGTAEVVKELTCEFKDANIQQFDRDVITTSAKLKKALKSFNDKEIDVLVGTQMLSKGHDYHDVTLAVVFGMDNMLNMSDYRAREKALSSLIQISGRSGRKKNAKVLVQSFNEEFFSAYIDRYEDFLEEEKSYREGLYPPYKKLCRIIFAHKNGIKAKEQMLQMRDTLLNVENIEVVGSGSCAIEKIANKYRFEILLRADKSTDLIKAVKFYKTDLAQVDMDPIDFI